MVSTETLQVILTAQDQLSNKVRQATDAIRNMGNTSSTASNMATQATNRLGNAYDTLRNKVSLAWNNIRQTIQQSALGERISSSGLARPYLNAAEQIRQRWTSMTEQIKSKLAGIAGTRVITIKGDNGEIIKKIQVTKNELNKIKEMNVDPFKNMNPQMLKVFNGELGQATIKAAQFNGTAIQVGNTTKTMSTQFTGLGSLASVAFTKMGNGIQSFKAKMSGAKDKITNLASGLSGLQGMIMSAFGAVGVTSMKSFIIDAGIAREKINAVTRSVAGSEEAFKRVNTSIKAATSGTTLGYNNMAKAVNNVALRFHVTGEAVGNLAGPMAKVGVLAQAMGKSTEEAAGLMEHAYDGLLGKWRSLKQFGITEADLKAAGWSGAANDVEGYAKALDKVLEKNPKLKEFTSTFEYQFEQFKMSVRGVGTEIGVMLLPSLKRVVEALNDLAKNHPELFKLVVIVGLVVLSLSSLAMMVLPILQVVWALKELSIISTIIETLGKLNLSTKLVSAATTVWTTVTKLATMAQAAFNMVMAMNPIYIVVMAIIALIAILVYLYYTNEDVRNALNNLWNFLVTNFIGAWNWLYNTLLGLWSWLSTTFIGIWDWIKGAFDNASQAVNGLMQWLNWLWQTFLTVLPWIMAIVTPWSILFDQNFRQTASNAVMGFINWIATLPGKLWTWLWNTILKVIEWARQIVAKFKKAAGDAVNGFIDFLKSLPGKAWAWLINTLTKIQQFAIKLYNDMKKAAKDAVDAFKEKFDIAKIVQQKLEDVKTAIQRKVGGLVQAMKNLARDMWNSFWSMFGGGATTDQVVELKGLTSTMDSVISRVDNVHTIDSSALASTSIPLAVYPEQSKARNKTNDKLDSIMSLLEVVVDQQDTTLNNSSGGLDGQSVMLEQSGTVTIQHDFNLENVPSGIDETSLIELLKQAITNRDVIKELTNSREFQSMDRRVKNKIIGEYSRHI